MIVVLDAQRCLVVTGETVSDTTVPKTVVCLEYRKLHLGAQFPMYSLCMTPTHPTPTLQFCYVAFENHRTVFTSPKQISVFLETVVLL
jgi:hypothetical protein